MLLLRPMLINSSIKMFRWSILKTIRLIVLSSRIFWHLVSIWKKLTKINSYLLSECILVMSLLFVLWEFCSIVGSYPRLTELQLKKDSTLLFGAMLRVPLLNPILKSSFCSTIFAISLDLQSNQSTTLPIQMLNSQRLKRLSWWPKLANWPQRTSKLQLWLN